MDKATGNTAATASSGETISVTFSHDMKYTGELPNSSITVSKGWSYQLGVTGASVSMSPSSAPSPTLGTFTPDNNNSTQVVPSHTYQVTLPVVESGSQTVTICERITYRGKKLNGTTWSDEESYSRACATITVKPEGPIPSACPLPNSSYSINKGGTQAASAVRNMSTDNTWQQTSTSNNTAVVWAKPGDTVQFKHTLCFGAQAVRGSNNPGGNGSSSPDRTLIPSVSNTATITAFTTPGSGSANYLFGKTLTGTNTQSFTLTRGSAQPSAVSSADERGDYYFTYYSPSQKSGKAAGDTYKCYIPSLGFLTFKQNGYQIPGFTNSTMPSNCEAVSSSDVGKVIEQDLNWTDVKSWINTQSSGGSGSCSCGNNSAGDVNVQSVNYENGDSSNSGTHVLKCYDTGADCGACCNEYCTRLCDNVYAKTDYWYYPITTTSTSGTTQKAQVKIPYNYTTGLSTSIDNLSGVVFAGEDANVSASVAINTRDDNPNISGDYATISKPSTYEIVAFTVPANYNVMPSQLYGNSNYSGSASKSACSYYGISGGRCQSVRRESNVYFNDEGNLNGDVEAVLSTSMNIPDIEVGWKYCVAVGVFPSNSHNSISRPQSNDPALDANNASTWNYSKASCVTIAKKPSVQFQNSDLITDGGIATSTSKKNVGYNLPGNNSGCSFSGPTKATGGNCGVSDNNKSRRVFGSWAEYSVVAGGRIAQFGSGAAYGYERNNGGSYTKPGGYVNVDYKAEPSTCTYSTQSINNGDCDSEKTAGLSSINPSSINMDRLLARYTSSATEDTQSAGRNLDLEGTCVAGNDGKYYPSRDGRNISNTTSYICLDNGAKYVKVNGDAYISGNTDWYCMGPGSDSDSRTAVLDISGTLTIDTNFVYGSLSGGKCNETVYTSLSQIPQMLIFAKTINITGSVTNIDAWLIADEGNGTINTCSDVSSYTGLTADKCNKQLIINGPVFAGKLILNRTYGAGTGNASIDPAEIFNLRNDAYYWAYNQAQRFSQAVTVYSQELAPRF